jgi:small-conductance mechanosensitive channel
MRALRSPEIFRRRELRESARRAARRGRVQLKLLVPLLAGVVAVYHWRMQVFGADEPVRIATAIVLLIVGWQIARNVGRVLRPHLVRRLDPPTAGVAGFLVRLVAIAVMLLVSLRIAGLRPADIVLGASFTAVVLGLAAQQTFGNILAGVVLLSARPFQIGDRVRFHGFGMDTTGTIASFGLLYVTAIDGDDIVLVPNNTALTMSVRPIREPESVEMRAKLPADTDPEAIERRVKETISVPTRGSPKVDLEEYAGDEVTMRVKATPQHPSQATALARDVLNAVAGRENGHGSNGDRSAG